MKRLSILIAVVVICCVCVENVRAASPEVEKARQHGALGQVTLRVEDAIGNPVEGARVRMVFWASDSSANVVLSEGTTDTNGLLLAEGMTIHSMNYTITKDGYYKTAGRYWFYRPSGLDANKSSAISPTSGEYWLYHQGENGVKDGRWQPWNTIHPVVLKEKRNPTAMYARHVDVAIPVRDQPIAFDLEVGDWVAPYGKGSGEDFCFTYRSDIKDFWTGRKELAIACTNRMDGFYRAQRDTWSEYESVYEAAENGYSGTVSLILDATKDRVLKSEGIDEREFLVFRVRTVIDEKGGVIRANYGKIYGRVEYGVGEALDRLRFTYYLNPTPNDRNLEFDPKQNLFKDLKPMERVREP